MDYCVRAFAPAKINWSLTVRGRREDGFHDIDTVFQALNWGDELFFRPVTGRRCKLICGHPDVPLDETNLIVQAWRLMKGAFPSRVGGVEVFLKKRIPMGAGLGGGSSDAVAALAAIRKLFEVKVSPDELERMAASLGSDCPFFVRGGAQKAGGRGEKLVPLRPGLRGGALALVWPGFASPTARAYRRIVPGMWSDGGPNARMARAVAEGDWMGVRRAVRNVFDEALTQAHPGYQAMRQAMADLKLGKPTLTGSGSAMFAFCPDAASARRAAEILKTHFPVAEAVGVRQCGVRAQSGQWSLPQARH